MAPRQTTDPMPEFMTNLESLIRGFRSFREFDRLLLDKPEDRLFHASDETWWARDKKYEDHVFFSPILVRTDPPPFVQKLQKENKRLKAEVKRLKAQLKR